MFYSTSDTKNEPIQSGAYVDALDEFKTIATKGEAALALVDERGTALAAWSGTECQPHNTFIVLIEPDDYCPDSPFTARHEVTDGSCDCCGAKNFN